MAANEPDRTEALSLDETQDQSGCEHHWVLAAPNGPTSKGVCRSCGEERDFRNHLVEDWGQGARRRASSHPG